MRMAIAAILLFGLASSAIAQSDGCGRWVEESVAGVTHRVRQCEQFRNGFEMEDQFTNTTGKQLVFDYKVVRFSTGCPGSDDISEHWYGRIILAPYETSDTARHWAPADKGMMQTCYTWG